MPGEPNKSKLWLAGGALVLVGGAVAFSQLSRTSPESKPEQLPPSSSSVDPEKETSATAEQQHPEEHEGHSPHEPTAAQPTAPVVVKESVDGLSGASMMMSGEAGDEKEAKTILLEDANEPVHLERGIDARLVGKKLAARLIPEVESGKPILLLPNVGGITWFSNGADDRLRGRITDPRFVRGVIEHLLEKGATKITLGASWAVGKPRAVQTMLTKSGYRALADSFPEVTLLDLFQYGGSEPGDSQTKLVPVKTPDAAQLEPELLLAEVVKKHLETGLVINIPKFKMHRFSVITAGMKNMMGIINLKEGPLPEDGSAPISKWKMHRELGGVLSSTKGKKEWSDEDLKTYARSSRLFSRRLADVYQVARAHITLIDGVLATDGNGFDSIGSVPLCVGIGSRNPAYADYVAAKMAGYWWNADLAKAAGSNSPLGVGEALRRFYGAKDGPPKFEVIDSSPSLAFLTSGGRMTLELMNRRLLPGSYRAKLSGDFITPSFTESPPDMNYLRHHFPLGRTRFIVRDWAGNRLPPGMSAAVFLAHTKTDLIVAFRAETIHRDVRPHDGPPNLTSDTDALFKWDNFEVFVDPTPSTPKEYYELEVSPEGEYLDIHIKNGPGKADPSWESKMKIEVNESDGVWIAKLTIPFESLGVDPEKMEKTWRANFYRTERYGDKRIYSAWQPTMTSKPNFHAPEKFGEIRFE